MAHGLEQQLARRDDFLYLDVSDPRDAEATERLGFTSTPHFFFLGSDGPVVETIQRVVPRASVAGALERLAGTAARQAAHEPTTGHAPACRARRYGSMATFSRRATLDWTGDVLRGTGAVIAGSEAFTVGATFPRIHGEPAGHTTPEELLAAAHATCFGIGLRSVIAQRGGTARRVHVTATITAEKGGGAIRIQSSHLTGEVEGLAGVAVEALPDIAHAAEEGCTITAAIRGAVAISVDVRAI